MRSPASECEKPEVVDEHGDKRRDDEDRDEDQPKREEGAQERKHGCAVEPRRRDVGHRLPIMIAP